MSAVLLALRPVPPASSTPAWTCAQAHMEELKVPLTAAALLGAANSGAAVNGLSAGSHESVLSRNAGECAPHARWWALTCLALCHTRPWSCAHMQNLVDGVVRM